MVRWLIAMALAMLVTSSDADAQVFKPRSKTAPGKTPAKKPVANQARAASPTPSRRVTAAKTAPKKKAPPPKKKAGKGKSKGDVVIVDDDDDEDEIIVSDE